MLKPLSDIINKNIGEIQKNISTIEEIDFSELNPDDFLKYQNISNNINTKISQNNQMVGTLTKFITICDTIVTILMALPIPTAPFPITVGLILTASKKLSYLQKLLDDIKSYLSIYTKINETQTSDLAELAVNFKNDENNFLINNPNPTKKLNDNVSVGMNLNKIVTQYKNYDIYLKEDTSSKFIKYYAVAIDKNGKEFLRTDSSHLTNTQILIDKTKFLINKYY